MTNRSRSRYVHIGFFKTTVRIRPRTTEGRHPHFCSVGDKNRHALVRNCVDIATSDNLTDFLVEMGFRMDHEFVAKGHVFRKGIMKIVVYKIFRILMPGNTDSIEPLSLSYLVELNVVAPAGQDIVSDDMRNFAEQLKPLVHLEKIDPKRLM